MPELPEVETIRRGVQQKFAGRRIRTVEVSGARSLRRHPDPAEFVSRVQGRRLVGTDRRGKYLLLRLDSGDVVVAHMGMSGQLLAARPTDPPRRHTHGLFGFSGAMELRFVDPRTFGELFVTGPEAPELAHLGFDPLAGGLSAEDFAGRLRPRSTKLKPLLMDQRFVAGIGNIYSDEILFAAGLRPDRVAGQLSGEEAHRLYRSMGEVLVRAVEHRGSSLADEQYRDLFGQTGGFQKLHNVYARAGLACPRCQGVVVRVKAAGRSNFFCPACQN